MVAEKGGREESEGGEETAGQEGGATDGEDNKRVRGWGWREGQERRGKG